MSDSRDWSPDEALETETFEAWDEALDAEDEDTPGLVGAPEGERSLDRQLFVDEAEIEEAGIALDDPERMAVLDGGIDDPDGIDVRYADAGTSQEQGWQLDAGDDAEEDDDLSQDE